MKIALAQLNPTVGDLQRNSESIIRSIEQARQQGAELVVFSELAICGYPPRDLLLAEGFVEQCAQHAKEIGTKHSKGICVIIGTPLPLEPDGVCSSDANGSDARIANSLVVYKDNTFVGYYDKRLLPTYDVFDEDRYFTAGREPRVIEIHGCKVGLAICEDLWMGHDAGFAQRYCEMADPITELVEAGAEIIIAPSASPFAAGKHTRHREIISEHAKRHAVPVLSVNQVGANDDLVFAGGSCAVDARGCLAWRAPFFSEQISIIDHSTLEPTNPPEPGENRMIIEALTLGIRDYLRKCGFSKACVGLSGGIDSALVATLAVRALGADAVTGASMPGQFSSQGSKDDAYALAENLGIECVSMPIEPGFSAISSVLDPSFEQLGQPALGVHLPDLAQENLQSRIRGTMMMALSNRTGALVLTTGNKSEIAVGYCTLYGDMNGGLAVIADVPKTRVFSLCRSINEHADELGFPCPPIPLSTIEKPPSAELAPDQLDSDSLPDYETLDEIISRHVERHQNAASILAQTGFDRDTVNRICALIDRNEYKRQQMAIGLRVTSKAFGSGRRMPVAQRWTRTM